MVILCIESVYGFFKNYIVIVIYFDYIIGGRIGNVEV